MSQGHLQAFFDILVYVNNVEKIQHVGVGEGGSFIRKKHFTCVLGLVFGHFYVAGL